MTICFDHLILILVQAFEIQMNWNMMEFLPEEGGIRKQFSDTVVNFIHKVYTHLTSSEPSQGTPRRRRTTLSQLTQPTQYGAGAHTSTTNFVSEFISNDLRDRLFLYVFLGQDQLLVCMQLGFLYELFFQNYSTHLQTISSNENR